MNDKITMTRLAAMLAISSGKQKKLCEDFLKELFAIVEEELTKGENVRIKGFGTFKIVEVEPRKSVNVANGEETVIPGHNKVLFVAAKELASRVNLPFEAFEAVEIADELTTDSLEGEVVPGDESDQEPKFDSESDPVADSELKEGSEEEYIEDKASVEAYSGSVESDSQSVESDSQSVEAISDADKLESVSEKFEQIPMESESKSVENDLDSKPQDDYNQEYSDESFEELKTHKFRKGFIAGLLTALIGCGIVFGIGYLWGFSFGISKGEKMEETVPADIVAAEVVSPDSVESQVVQVNDSVTNIGKNVDDGAEGYDVPTKVSDEPVYDIVSTTRYLTTIAKEHYGNFNLWPIIYEENKDILGHPDRIRPGTKVIVPPLSKYGIDPKNADQVKAVKQKGIEIYARFK